MSPTEPRWAVSPDEHTEADGSYPGCRIHDTAFHGDTWLGRICVYGERTGEATALAQLVADLLNAHEELHRDS